MDLVTVFKCISCGGMGSSVQSEATIGVKGEGHLMLEILVYSLMFGRLFVYLKFIDDALADCVGAAFLFVAKRLC